jgi:hypothetical protein
MNNPMLIDPIDLFTGEALTASGGATPSKTYTPPLMVAKLSKIHVFVQNAGASTNCVITIKGKPTLTSTLESVLAVFTLGAAGAGADKAGRYIEQFPSYIYATAVNADAVNAANVTITLNRFR